MKVCLIADEYFSWGIHGGFGFFTRKLGTELAKRGIEVEAVIQKISDEQKAVGESEEIDGVSVLTLPRKKLGKATNARLYKTDADVLHSQSGMLDTWLMFRRNSQARRIITFQDPQSPKEMAEIMKYESVPGYTWYRRLWGRVAFQLYKRAVRGADLTASQTKFKITVVKELFGLKHDTMWLPNMVDVPDSLTSKKADRPTCVFPNRLDPKKRPEIYCSLATRFPEVDFFVLGRSHMKGRDEMLRAAFDQPNLHFMGFVDEDTKRNILEAAWVSVNTSIYECLPVAFLESVAQGCSILSWVDPDNFATDFGCHVEEPTVEGFAQGLSYLLKDDVWRLKGSAGYATAKAFYDTPRVVQQHIDVYRSLIRG
jgi:glycosyltransferase involved in cell wall biosynthesis